MKKTKHKPQSIIIHLSPAQVSCLYWFKRKFGVYESDASATDLMLKILMQRPKMITRAIQLYVKYKRAEGFEGAMTGDLIEALIAQRREYRR